ncbi:MAG: L-2-amino-thiazoline-4-carboxylic acid hydrolase [Lachnospiraceae bacterium]|nr:L-2-amino-thiazoline-4-carboxylic acid hydrolase [Lachnospiraceae bacterium]
MLAYKDNYWKLLTRMLHKSLVQRFGKEGTKALLQKADSVYRDMLSKVDDVGADNPMSSNIYQCFVFLALYKASEGKISVADLRNITREFMGSPLMKLASLKRNLNKEKGVQDLSNLLHNNVAYLEEHPQYKDASWDFHFDETLHKDGFYYHFTHCPLNDFARRENMLEVLPVMCDIDFLTARIMHSVLHREQTLASGGTMCDYWFVGDKIKDPQ